MDYRLYLMDAKSHIRAGEFFVAEDDTEATQVAAAIYDACRDAFARYELWCGVLLISQSTPHAGAKLNLDDIVAARQASILDLEDRLEATFATLRRSSKLAEARAHLRHQFIPAVQQRPKEVTPL